MVHQLKPSILVETPLGIGEALFIIDYGMHLNIRWVVTLEDDGTIKNFDCNDIVLATMGISLKKPNQSANYNANQSVENYNVV